MSGRGREKAETYPPRQVSLELRCLISKPTILPIAPPTTITPARILSLFIIFSSRPENSALSPSEGVSVGAASEGEGGGASDVTWGEGGGTSEVKWCDGANPSGSVVA